MCCSQIGFTMVYLQSLPFFSSEHKAKMERMLTWMLAPAVHGIPVWLTCFMVLQCCIMLDQLPLFHSLYSQWMLVMCQKLGVLPAEERAAELLAQFRTQRPTAARRSNWWLVSYLPNNPYIVFRGAASTSKGWKCFLSVTVARGYISYIQYYTIVSK